MLSAFILAKNLSRKFPSVNSRFATEGNFRDTVFDKIDQHVEATGFDGNRAHDKGFMEEAKNMSEKEFLPGSIRERIVDLKRTASITSKP